MEVRARVRQEAPDRWRADADTEPLVRASGSSLGRSLASLIQALRRTIGDESVTVVVEVVPLLAGVAEAAEIMGWDKRRVITYIDRGRFPQPVQSLASGRVWLRSDVERFADAWRAKQARRALRRMGGRAVE